MAIYTVIDLEITDDGDLVIDQIGDLKLASPLRTTLQAINVLLLTNKGDLLTDTDFGANLVQFVGENNIEPVRSMMERQITSEVDEQGLIVSTDFDVDVIALGIHEIGILANVRGTFIETEDTGNLGGIIDVADGVTIGYIYPLTGNTIIPISSADETSHQF